LKAAGFIFACSLYHLAQEIDYLLAFGAVEALEHLIRNGGCDSDCSSGSFSAEFRQREHVLTAVMDIGPYLNEAALTQPIYHVLDGGPVHQDEAAELVLRAESYLKQLCHRGELDAGQSRNHTLAEQDCISLRYCSQQKPDLIL
jgi:hypothetical protein